MKLFRRYVYPLGTKKRNRSQKTRQYGDLRNYYVVLKTTFAKNGPNSLYLQCEKCRIAQAAFLAL